MDRERTPALAWYAFVLSFATTALSFPLTFLPERGSWPDMVLEWLFWGGLVVTFLLSLTGLARQPLWWRRGREPDSRAEDLR